MYLNKVYLRLCSLLLAVDVRNLWYDASTGVLEPQAYSNLSYSKRNSFFHVFPGQRVIIIYQSRTKAAS